MHIQTSIDNTIQNILKNKTPTICLSLLDKLCPNECSGNGVCEKGMKLIFLTITKYK